MILAAVVFGLVFLVTGFIVVVLDAKPAIWPNVRAFQTFIYGTHIFQWMVLGMLANYLWDFYQTHQKSWDGLGFGGLVAPLIVSPLIFYSVWTIWRDKNISFVLDLVAFQNGFFWQVIFSKASHS